jgi:hypothetical protein
MGVGSLSKLEAVPQDGPRIVNIPPPDLDAAQRYRFQQDQFIHPLQRLNASLPGVPLRGELFEPMKASEKAKQSVVKVME